jgi:hypothetical protein
VSQTFPGLAQLAFVLEPELVADGQADLARLELGQDEPSDVLLVETFVPADDQAVLRLGLLELLVVVGLDLDEGPEDVLVLVRVLVSTDVSGFVRQKETSTLEKDGLRLVVDARLLQIVQGGGGVVLPQLLELVDLRPGDLPGAGHLGLGRDLDEPGQKLAVLDQRRPGRGVPDHVLLPAGRAGLAAEQDDDGVALGGDEAQQEDVAGAAGVALGPRSAQGRRRMQLHG